MKPELRKIAKGFICSVNAFDAYDVNGYCFHTHKYTQSRPNRKTINSGVLCEGSDGLHYYCAHTGWEQVRALTRLIFRNLSAFEILLLNFSSPFAHTHFGFSLCRSFIYKDDVVPP